MPDRSYDEIRQEFLEIYAGIRDLSDDEILFGPNTFNTTLDRLWRLGQVQLDDNAGGQMLSNPHFAKTARRLNHLLDRVEIRGEMDDARSLVAASDPYSHLRSLSNYPVYRQMVAMECAGAELKAGQRLIFLGSGPLPLTLILFHQEHGIDCLGIEQDRLCAELSQKVIDTLGLGEHICIVRGNHLSLPSPGPCHLLLISYEAKPKDEIFAYLAEVLPDGARVAYRIPDKTSSGRITLSGLRSLTAMDASTFPSAIPAVFREYRRLPPRPPVPNTLVLTVKDARGPT